MSLISYNTIEGYKSDGAPGSDVCESYTHGDPLSRYIWDKGWNACFKVLNWLFNATANGQLLIGNNTTHRFNKGVPTGSGGVTVTTGPGTLAVSIEDGDIATAKLSQAARTQLAQSITLLDLAGGAQNDIPIFAPNVDCTLISAYLIYQTAAGSTPAAINLGRSGLSGSSTYFVSAQPTTASAAQFDPPEALTLVATDVPAGATVYCSTDGVGDAGKVLVCLTYMVD